MPEAQLVFLMGVMRSGTTFLRNALSANRAVFSLGPERNVFWSTIGQAPCGVVPENPRLTAPDAAAAAAVREQTWRQVRRRHSPRPVAERLYRKLRRGNETLLKRGRPLLVLEKSTQLCNKIPYVDAIFPDARYIFILRELRSQACSMKHHLTRAPESEGYRVVYPDDGGGSWRFLPSRQGVQLRFEDVPRYWIEQNALALTALEALGPERVIHLRFRELVERPGALLARLEDFLGARLRRDFSDALINNHTSDPLRAWEQQLSAEELAIIDRVARERAEEHALVQSYLQC